MPSSLKPSGKSYVSTISRSVSSDSVSSLEKPNVQERRLSHGSSSIACWSILLISPMLLLSLAISILVYTHHMPDSQSSYSFDGKTSSLGSAFYISCSATAFAFLASVSSTLSTVLIGPAMILFSYPLAHNFASESDRQSASSALPTPYHLDILIRFIDGRPSALWSYCLYVFGARRKKTPSTPLLRRAVLMLCALVFLA